MLSKFVNNLQINQFQVELHFTIHETLAQFEFWIAIMVYKVSNIKYKYQRCIPELSGVAMKKRSGKWRKRELFRCYAHIY